MKVKIADSLFSPWSKNVHGMGDNAGTQPSHFEWEVVGDGPITTEARFVTEFHLQWAKGEGQVAWMLEPFFLHPERYMMVMEKKFDYVLTSNRYFAENQGWLWHPFGGTAFPVECWGVQKKYFNVSLPMSIKNTMAGHRLRHQISSQYHDRINGFFGEGGTYRKWDSLSTYRYAIIVENEKAPGYFTEKLIDAFAVGTVPIYWGCPDVDQYFDLRGVLRFDTLEQLEVILSWIGEEDYHKRELAIATNLTLARKYAICEDWIYEHYPFLFGVGA